MAYCHMDELPNCGGGGWTLTMKINGSKNTFDYNSFYWTNRQALKAENGLGLEDKESKLPTYWSTPLTKICLGMKMKTNSDIKWLKLELKQRADSLYDVMTTGNPTQPYTLLGVEKWKDTFMPRIRYRFNNPREGVNATFYDRTGRVRVKLGVVYRFGSFLTYLGFGPWGSWHQKYNIDISCGYGREDDTTPHYKKIHAFCYILVQ
ncbi:uncharacterized skeletal organic matrix protein 5-like [Actinia tenebrosa]|uniref:Uncharacterized skeletal organic matrix protein 5-like n=1 Tax=Actinia tenebrosa TaxID=6105 RepID=A0A6P8HT98_ACTTE|nr:uncharacterized skeletal organic matrix protein 5-like [Actinia tenebrosa]